MRGRDGDHPDPPGLGAAAGGGAGPLALAGHDDLVLDRVPLLLAAVVAALPPAGAADGLLGGVEEQLAHLVGAQLGPALGEAEHPGQQRLQGVDVPADRRIVHAEEEPQERVGDVRAVVDQKHQQPVAQGRLELAPRTRLAAPARPLGPAGPGLLFQGRQAGQQGVELRRPDPGQRPEARRRAPQPLHMCHP